MKFKLGQTVITKNISNIMFHTMRSSNSTHDLMLYELT